MSRLPDDQRCTANTRYWPSGDPGPPCNARRATGHDVCSAHRDNSHVHYRPPPPERRCTGTAKKTGSRCTQWAMKGQTVCYRHGGNSPQALQAAAKRIEDAKLNNEANKALISIGGERCDDPLTALAERAGTEIATWRSLADQVNTLHERDELRYTDAKGSEQLRSEAAMYERSAVRVDAILGLIAKLNIDDRLVVIEEKKVAKVIDALTVVLAHFGITGQQAAEAQHMMARRLRSLS